MFAYIAAAPFVLQNIMGRGTFGYSLAFTANAVGLTLTSVVSAKLVMRHGPLRLTYIGVGALWHPRWDCSLPLFLHWA